MARKTRSPTRGSGRPLEEAVLVRRVVGAKSKRLREIRFDYIKSNLFRVIHADGFHGGLTPNGKVQMGVFSERKPFARSEVYGVSADSTLGPMRSRIERNAMVREIEASIVMDLDKAIALRGWLDKMLEQVAELQSRAAKRRKRV